mgnify:CR=1 FL=1
MRRTDLTLYKNSKFYSEDARSATIGISADSYFKLARTGNRL